MTPYKLYINWTGEYTAGVMSGVFVDITDEAYNLAITVTRQRDKKSIAIVRNFAKGNFIVKDDNYDLLETAITNGLPELIIRIDKYSTVAVDYVEVWRGTAETRPSEMDKNRKIAKITKFKTIDKYSDLEIAYSKSYTESFADYMTGNILFENGSASAVSNSAKKLFFTELSDGIDESDWNNHIDSKYSENIAYVITPGYYDSGFNFFFGSFGLFERGLIIDSIDNMLNSNGAETSLSLKKILEIYQTMFNLFWYLDEAVYTLFTTQTIQLKTPAQLFNINTIDYTSESADFAKFHYLDTEYFIREEFSMSDSNNHIDHRTQFYEYQLLAENNFTYANDNIMTDMSAHVLTTEMDNGDIVPFIPNITAGGGAGLVESALGINTPALLVTNYKCSLSYRLKNYLNDYRQLDSAKFNGSLQNINPNIRRPSIRQEAFNIELDLLKDLDFFATIQTSIGDTYAEELIWDLKTGGIKLICQK